MKNIKKINENDEKKIRTIRLSDSVWNDFQKLKNRDDKSWDLFLKELIDIVKYFKNL